MKTTLRDRWLDFWHALPPFRGRLAIARVVASAFGLNFSMGRGGSDGD